MVEKKRLECLNDNGNCFNFGNSDSLNEGFIESAVNQNTVIINGVEYDHIDKFECRRKYLVKIDENRYWAIADTSCLVFNSKIFKQLINWVDKKLAEYKTSSKVAFRRETRIGKSQKQTSYISESQEFAKEIGINRTTVQKWIKEYLVAVEGSKKGPDLYHKLFSSNPQRKKIPWHSHNFLEDLVNKVSMGKIGQLGQLKTTPCDLKKIVDKNNSKNVQIKKEKIRIECPIHGNFKKRYVDLYEGQWCRQCANEEMSKPYDEINERGAELGYFLENNEKDFNRKKEEQKKAPTHTILKWLCLSGHINYKSMRNILSIAGGGRYGCKTCYRLSIIITYEEFLKGVYNAGFKTKISKQEFVQIRSNCINNNLILTHDVQFNIICSENHTFPAFYGSITSKYGIKCPYCGMTALQKGVHLYMEVALKVPFESEVDIRRIILTETRYLKVDGYGEIYLGGRLIRIVFEAMGKQHRFFVKRFHNSQKDLDRQKERDDYLRDLLKAEGIVLIEFWYDDLVSQYKELLNEQFYKQTKKLEIFKDGYELQNIPQFTSRVLHNKFLGATQTNQRQIKDFY